MTMALDCSSRSLLPTSIGWVYDPFSGRGERRNIMSSSSSQSCLEFDDPGGMLRCDGGWGEMDEYLDPATFLPSDPFGMHMDTKFSAAMAGWMEDLGMVSGSDCLFEGLSYYCQRALREEFLDPVDLLPSDPFGMDMDSIFTAVIAGWIEDITNEYGVVGDQLLEHLSYCWNWALWGEGVDSPVRLPFDPFGVILESTITAAITGWIEDFRATSHDSRVACVHCSAGFNRALLEDNVHSVSIGEFGVVSCDHHLVCNQSVAESSRNVHWALLGSSEAEVDNGAGLHDTGDVDRSARLSYGAESEDFENGVEAEEVASTHGSEVAYTGGNAGIPHDGMLFALGHLGVRGLLSVERVCKSLCSAVQNDPLLWRSIHIHSHPSERITDDVLLRLTQRAQGRLQCLSLVCCTRITDNGLRRVFQNNPKLDKLYLIECVSLSTAGLIRDLKAFQSRSVPGIKNLKLGRTFNVSDRQLEELKLLLGMDMLKQPPNWKPRYYHISRYSLRCDDDRVLDIETCPICLKCGIVFDCPKESCQCRGCGACVRRCAQCGNCIAGTVFREKFLFEHVCPDCWDEQYIW